MADIYKFIKMSLRDYSTNLQLLKGFLDWNSKNAYVAYIDRSINSISKTAEERYFEFCEKYRAIEQRVPQYLLASYLGMTPEFLSLLRKKNKKSSKLIYINIFSELSS